MDAGRTKSARKELLDKKRKWYQHSKQSLEMLKSDVAFYEDKLRSDRVDVPLPRNSNEALVDAPSQSKSKSPNKYIPPSEEFLLMTKKDLSDWRKEKRLERARKRSAQDRFRQKQLRLSLERRLSTLKDFFHQETPLPDTKHNASGEGENMKMAKVRRLQHDTGKSASHEYQPIGNKSIKMLKSDIAFYEDELGSNGIDIPLMPNSNEAHIATPSQSKSKSPNKYIPPEGELLHMTEKELSDWRKEKRKERKRNWAAKNRSRQKQLVRFSLERRLSTLKALYHRLGKSASPEYKPIASKPVALPEAKVTVAKNHKEMSDTEKMTTFKDLKPSIPEGVAEFRTVWCAKSYHARNKFENEMTKTALGKTLRERQLDTNTLINNTQDSRLDPIRAQSGHSTYGENIIHPPANINHDMAALIQQRLDKIDFDAAAILLALSLAEV